MDNVSVDSNESLETSSASADSTSQPLNPPPPPPPPMQPLVSCLKNSSKSISNSNGNNNANSKGKSKDGQDDGSNGKEKGTVKFVEYITVTECLHFLDYSKKEYKGTWFTSKEMAKSRDDYRHVLEMSSSSSATSSTTTVAATAPSSEDEHTELLSLRGLEHKTRMGSRRREQNKLAAWQAVEKEQYRQWQQGYKDPQALADEYQNATQHCVHKAIQVGQDDRQAVLQQAKYYEIDGLTVESISASEITATLLYGSSNAAAKRDSSSSSCSSASTNHTVGGSPLFGAAAFNHHQLHRPRRSQGRMGVSRAA